MSGVVVCVFVCVKHEHVKEHVETGTRGLFQNRYHRQNSTSFLGSLVVKILTVQIGFRSVANLFSSCYRNLCTLHFWHLQVWTYEKKFSSWNSALMIKGCSATCWQVWFGSSHLRFCWSNVTSYFWINFFPIFLLLWNKPCDWPLGADWLDGAPL